MEQRTSRQIASLAVTTAEPVMQQSTALARFLVAHLVQLTESRAVGIGAQFALENDNVQLRPLPLDPGLGAEGSEGLKDLVPVEGRHVRGGGIVWANGLPLCEGECEQAQRLVEVGEAQEVQRVVVRRRLDMRCAEVEFGRLVLDLVDLLDHLGFQQIESAIGKRRSWPIPDISEVDGLHGRSHGLQGRQSCSIRKSHGFRRGVRYIRWFKRQRW